MIHDQPASARQQSESLDEIRRSMDVIDQEMIRLFCDRLNLSLKIATLKKNEGLAVYVPDREQEKIKYALKQVPASLKRKAESFLRTLMRLSRSIQYESQCNEDVDFEAGRLLTETEPAFPNVRRIVTQGAAGSWSEKAGRVLFPDADAQQTATFSQACDLVRDGSVDVAVLPLENSTAGTVDDVYTLLLKNQLYIWRSLSLPIRHHLLVRPGTSIDQIRTVVSHPQALAQCSDFIKKMGWSVREAQNTAFAAKEVAETGDAGLSAIGSPEAAEAYHLFVLSDEINNTKGNRTRFIAVGRQFLVTPDAERISLILKLPHTVGSLSSALSVFSDSGFNLSKIQSKPDLENPWTYLFYIDLECTREDLSRALAVLCQLSYELPYLRLLGWYGEIDLC